MSTSKYHSHSNSELDKIFLGKQVRNSTMECEVCGKRLSGNKARAGHMWLAHHIRTGILAELDRLKERVDWLDSYVHSIRRTDPGHLVITDEEAKRFYEVKKEKEEPG